MVPYFNKDLGAFVCKTITEHLQLLHFTDSSFQRYIYSQISNVLFICSNYSREVRVGLMSVSVEAFLEDNTPIKRHVQHKTVDTLLILPEHPTSTWTSLGTGAVVRAKKVTTHLDVLRGENGPGCKIKDLL